jgi:hypothetical protein
VCRQREDWKVGVMREGKNDEVLCVDGLSHAGLPQRSLQEPFMRTCINA